MSHESVWARQAVAYVDARCHGAPLNRDMRITLNFHADRESKGINILDALAQDGAYRSQFETGTSNGGLTAHIGGDRWNWEKQLFGGAYDTAPASERPKYGALNHLGLTLGGAPRFGAVHLRLREHMLDRATYCFPDSSFKPTRFATAQRFGLMPLSTEFARIAASDPSNESYDPLDGYVEAHVHGRIILVEDVEALVMDPCYRDTIYEEKAHSLGVDVEWHEGRVLTLSALDEHQDYRGAEPVRIGREIARDEVIDALIIGDAVRSGRYGNQPLKQLWHLTAQWGVPRHVAR